MARESTQGIDNHEIFRETFDNTSVVHRNGTITGSPSFKEGYAEFTSSDSDKITYPDVRNIKTIVFDITLDTTSESIIDFDGGTTTITVDSKTIITGEGISSPTIYVDGVAGTAITTAKARVTITTATAINATAFDVGDGLDGKLHFLKLLDVEWSAAEVVLDYKGALYTDNKEGLIGHWMLSKAHSEGRNFYDLSGNGYTGVKDVDVRDPIFSYDQRGNLGKGLDFRLGGGDEIRIGDMGPAKSFTMWVKPSTNTTKEILRVATSGITIKTDTTTGVTTSGVGGAGSSWVSPTYYMDGEIGAGSHNKIWRYLVVTQTTGMATTSFAISNAPSTDFLGICSEVRVYDRVLTPTEIRMAYRRGRYGINT